MKMTRRSIQSLVVLLTGSVLIAATPATKPAPPAAAATSKPVMGADTSIAKDQYHFPAPPTPEWSAVKPDPGADSIVFINQAHDGQISILVLPKDADITDNVAAAVVKQLKQQYAQGKTVMVMGPKIEHDKRFGIVVHERYKVGDQIADQLHIYKQVGPRVLMLLVNTTNGDADKVKAIQDAAREMLDEAKFNRKAFKKE
jgi:hypothetical protein